MKNLIKISLIGVVIFLYDVVPSHAQNSGELWIKTFSPGSSDLKDSSLDPHTLAALDSLMQDPAVEATFLGAADERQWKMNGSKVHPDISDAWNDAKRLGRARIVRARYGRGQVGVTDENIAGVKVIWIKREDPGMISAVETSSANGHNDDWRRDVEALRSDIDSMRAALDQGKFTHIVEKSGINLNWQLQAGFWSWYGGSDRNILTPSLGLNVIYDRTVFVMQGGVAPWHTKTPFGRQGEAFLFAGFRRMPPNPKLGIGYAVGMFRGWEFYTSTDSWSLKSTGVAAGPIIRYGILELHPAATYAYIDSIFKGRGWRFGGMFMMNVNLN